MNVVELLKKLISFQSVTPLDAGGLDFISELLQKNGFQVYIQEFGLKKVRNLYAIYGAQSPNICFAGHIDVVPTGEGWRFPPFVANEENAIIYGRGAVDMKGAIACMIAAVLDLLQKKPRIEGSISFLITSDEEGEAEYGTKAMLEWMNNESHKIDFAIVGEPTCSQRIGDIIKIGRRGSINFDLKVSGIQGHVAYPDLATNPNNTIIRILNDLMDLKLDSGNEVFQPSNLEITSIDTGNSITNIIPAEVSAKVNIRFNNEHTSQDIIKKVIDICAKHTKNYELKHKISAEPFLSTRSEFTEIFIKAVKNITSIAPKLETSGGTSDARFIKNYCTLLEFGLLNDTAHKIDEHVKIGDLQKLYSVYYEFLSTAI